MPRLHHASSPSPPSSTRTSIKSARPLFRPQSSPSSYYFTPARRPLALFFRIMPARPPIAATAAVSTPRRRPPPPALTVVQTVHATNHPLVALAWSPTGHYLAAAVQHGPILLFAIQSSSMHPLRPEPIHTFRGHTADVLQLTFSPTHFLASASMDRSVRLWHPNTSVCLRHFTHPDMVTSVAFNPSDENLLLTAGCDGHARVWRLADHSVIAHADAGTVLTAAVFLGARTPVVGTYDGRLLRWRPHALLAASASPPPSPTAVTTTAGTSSLTDVLLDARRPRHRSKRARPVAARLTATVMDNSELHGGAHDGRKRRVFVTGAEGRMFELRDMGVHRRVRTNVGRKRGTPLPASISSDARYMTLDATAGIVRIMDCATSENPSRRKSDREVSVGVVSIQVFTQANVACATFAPESVAKRCGRVDGSNGTSTFLMAVGADDGSLTIIEQEYAML